MKSAWQWHLAADNDPAPTNISCNHFHLFHSFMISLDHSFWVLNDFCSVDLRSEKILGNSWKGQGFTTSPPAQREVNVYIIMSLKTCRSDSAEL